jgi:predicted metal-dependent phosphoesterase TrpH
MKLDLHIHSSYSKDSFLKPETILKIAKERGLSGIAITDDDTIKGGLVTQEINDDENFTVIVGSEVKTEYGDIIGLFLQDEITSRKFKEVVNEIKDQDGLVILAHPFRKGITFPFYLLKKIDLIEAFNARSSKNLNKKAFELATMHQKPIVAGSDSHIGFEIGRGKTIIEYSIKDSLKKGYTSIEGSESNFYLSRGFSFLIENIKKSDYIGL